MGIYIQGVNKNSNLLKNDLSFHSILPIIDINTPHLLKQNLKNYLFTRSRQSYSFHTIPKKILEVLKNVIRSPRQEIFYRIVRKVAIEGQQVRISDDFVEKLPVPKQKDLVLDVARVEVEVEELGQVEAQKVFHVDRALVQKVFEFDLRVAFFQSFEFRPDLFFEFGDLQFTGLVWGSALVSSERTW